MANIKITDLSAIADPISTDVLPIVDVSADTTNKVSIETLLKNAATGSASAPAFAFDADPNTGMYRSGADALAFSTGGTGRLFIDSSGNVGVGASPDSLLDIKGDTPEFYIEDSAAYGSAGSQIIFRGKDSGGTARNMAKIIGVGSGSNSGKLVIQTRNSGSLDDRVVVTSAGLVGIGTSSVDRLFIASDSADNNLPCAVITKTVTGGANSGLQVHTAGTDAGAGAYCFRVTAGNTYGSPTSEYLRVTAAGRVGIGTTSPRALLDVGGNAAFSAGTYQSPKLAVSNGYIGIKSDAADGVSRLTLIGDSSTGDGTIDWGGNIASALKFSNSGSERARIDSSGRLLVGTSTADNDYYISSVAYTPGIQFKGSGYNPSLALNRTDGGAFVFVANSQNITTSGRAFGGMSFNGFDGADLLAGARIAAEADGTTGTGDMPGRLVFSTTNDGSSSPTEKMRITETGTLTSLLGIYNVTTASAADVNISAAGTLRRSTSSSKYKSNVEEIDGNYSNALLNCRPVWYRSTCAEDNPNWGWWGFIAEEVAEIDPRLVHWKTTEVTYDENGSAVEEPCDPEPEGVAYDRFVPHLLNLIKRQKEQIEAQDTAIAALEARLSALEAS